MIRPMGNLLIDLLKGSSLVSLVTLADITYQGQVLRTETGQTTQIFAALLVIYFLLSSLIAWGIDLIERRVRRGLDAQFATSRKSNPSKEGVIA